MVSARFPSDLIELQRAHHSTYEALADRPEDAAALRRRLLRLSTRLFWHPYFDSPEGAARPELRRRAREGPAGV